MGQRSQIIVRTPKYFLNEDNPNNRPEQFLIYHNQWLYGFGFLKHLKEIIEEFEKYKAYYGKEMAQFTPDYKEMLEIAIKTANYKDVTNQRGTRLITGDGNANDWIANHSTKWEEVFNRLDNNNGFIFLDIDENGIISFDIVSGLEDTSEHERKTPLEYIKLFHDKKEIDNEMVEEKSELREIIEFLTKRKQFNYQTLELPKKRQKKYKCSFNKEEEKYLTFHVDPDQIETDVMDKLLEEVKLRPYQYFKIEEVKE